MKMTNKNKLPVIGKRYKKLNQEYTCVCLDLENDDDYYFYMLRDDEYFRKKYAIESYGEFEELPDQEPTTEESSTVDRKSRITDKVKEALEELKKDLAKGDSFDWETIRNNFISRTIKAKNLVTAIEEQPLIIGGEEFEFTSLKDARFNNSSSEPSKEEQKECGHEFYNEETKRYDVCCTKCGEYAEAIDLVECKRRRQETHDSSTVESASKSIWKPISELPKFCCDVVIKFTEDDICFATFSDDTNQFFMISETKGVVCISPPMEYARLTDFINQQASLEERITKLENK